jgi:excinuclease UvrABC ATPase subunit
MNDETMLLTYARRYFRAAAECQDLRKMAVLVDLGLDYLKLAARRKGSGAGPHRLRSANSAAARTSDANADD